MDFKDHLGIYKKRKIFNFRKKLFTDVRENKIVRQYTQLDNKLPPYNNPLRYHNTPMQYPHYNAHSYKLHNITNTITQPTIKIFHKKQNTT